MHVLHGGDEELGGVVGVHEHFVAHSDGFDLRGGVVVGDVRFHPCVGEGLVRGGVGEKLVGHGNHHLDS